jgi:hypothetical protein
LRSARPRSESSATISSQLSALMRASAIASRAPRSRPKSSAVHPAARYESTAFSRASSDSSAARTSRHWTRGSRSRTG